MDKKVTTLNGEVLDASECVKIKNKYYKIGNKNIENSGDCYLIDGSYLTVESGDVVFNITINQYVHAASNVTKGVISMSKDGELTFAYFTPSIENVIVQLPDESYKTFINVSLIDKRMEYVENMMDGTFAHISLLPISKLTSKKAPNVDYKNNLSYGADILGGEMQRIIDNITFYDSASSINEFVKILGNKTFGVEFETVEGIIPHYLLPETGLIPLRDGSIKGIEYSTGILQGRKGLQMLINACNELNTRTNYNDSCSLHYHIGGVPRTKEFILAMHLATLAVQNELFRIHPVYKEDNLRVKSKNYSKPFDIMEWMSKYDRSINSSNIDRNFNKLFQYLSQGRSFADYGGDLNNVKSHPSDESGRQKWHIKTRYHVINLVPLLFTNLKTVEFRIHLPDTNINHVMANLMINVMLVNYVERNVEQILSGSYTSLSLTDIILSSATSSRMSDFLITHMSNMRRAKETTAMRNKIMFTSEDFNTSGFYSFVPKTIKNVNVPLTLNLPDYSLLLDRDRGLSFRTINMGTPGSLDTTMNMTGSYSTIITHERINEYLAFNDSNSYRAHPVSFEIARGVIIDNLTPPHLILQLLRSSALGPITSSIIQLFNPSR